MVRSERFEGYLGRHPGAGLAICVIFVLICVVILIAAPHSRSPRSGVPMMPVCIVGIPLFSLAGIAYVRMMRATRGSGRVRNQDR
ncbi:MAG: hypothetical protein QOE20_3787 [Mycobacterium sp.]|jgi:hypothetical protein|nr:hypothetical protein [Mycobacterium sp.]